MMSKTYTSYASQLIVINSSSASSGGVQREDVKHEEKTTMKTGHVIGLSVLTLGAIAVQELHAQANPPVYFVSEISEVTDPEAFKAVRERPAESGAASLKDFGGQYISRTENITALDGTAPKRFVIIRFDNGEKAKRWYNSAEQERFTEIRMKASKSHSFLVEGM
jgi:uncharacterized protein (DUF1330 family)